VDHLAPLALQDSTEYAYGRIVSIEDGGGCNDTQGH